MANFRVHVLGAAIPAALAAGLAIASELVTPAVGGVCFALGVLGGMLPDIDADRSVPTRIIFGALAAILRHRAQARQPAGPGGSDAEISRHPDARRPWAAFRGCGPCLRR